MIHHRLIIILIVVLVSVAKLLSGQMIHGQLFDKETSLPLPFAHILVKGKSFGTISNQEGNYMLNCDDLSDQFSLTITSIGYKTARIDIDKNSLQKNYKLSLQYNATTLPEIEIIEQTPESILSDFHTHYAENYYLGNITSKAFYRTTFKENNLFVRLLEATVSIRESQTRKERIVESEIIEQRKSNDYRTEKWSESGNYMHQAMESDPVRNQSDFLDKKNLKHYLVKRLDNSSYNNQLVYVLSMLPKTSAKKPLYKATLYINASDYALIKAIYHYDNDYLKIRNLSYDRKMIHTSYAEGTIEYQKIGSWYFPKYLSGNTGFEIIDKITQDTLAKNILNNEVLFTNSQIDNGSSIAEPVKKWGDVYKKPFVYDPGYWRKQVRISPTKLYLEAVADLSTHQPIEIQYFNNSASPLMKQSFDTTAFGKVDSVLSIYHFADLFNGVALIGSDDSILLYKAYGDANLSPRKPLETSTRFDIGSITKQFTAAIILKMAEEGKLRLDDLVFQYLPDYKFGKEISIHNLLGHTSGIPTFDWENQEYPSSWFNNKIETNTFIENYCSGELEFEPNSKMAYSNSNYLLLTAIIEKIADKKYYEVLQEVILNPLDMRNTYSPDNLPDSNIAVGYVFDNFYKEEPKWEKSNVKGVGCVYSSAGDLLKWIEALNTTKLLSSTSIELMKSPLSDYTYYEADFGYSWAISRTTFSTKSNVHFYGGTSLGFYSMIANIPEKGITVVLLNNKGNFPRIELTNELINLVEESYQKGSSSATTISKQKY